jgi:hypothetical protein
MEGSCPGTQVACPTTSCPPAVTQAMLAEFVEIRRLLRRREELRVLILELLEAGRPVEAGPLTASVRRRERRALTAANLGEVIGEENLRVFMAAIPPVTFRRLVVGVNRKGWGATKRVRKPRP